MPKPIRRSDRQNRDILKNLFRRKDNAALVNPNEDYMTDDSGKPILNLLPEAEVAGTKTQYKEADLAKAGLLAGREALGMVPVVGEALDVAELSNIAKTGKDFYGDEADPAMYAGLTAAGMLIPNVVERPLKALGRGAKRFFKFGKKKDPNLIFDSIEGVDQYPTYQDPRYPLAVPAGKSAQSGVDFSRSFYADADVQDMLRKEYESLGLKIHPDAKKTAETLVGIDKVLSGVRVKMDRGNVRKANDELLKAVKKSGMTQTEFSKTKEGRRLVDNMLREIDIADAKHRELYEEGLKEAGIPIDVADRLVNVDRPAPSDYDFTSMPPGTDLEFTFLRGSQSPEILSSAKAQGSILDQAAGSYHPYADRTYVNPLAPNKRGTSVHETAHFGSASTEASTSEVGEMIKREMSSIVKPEYARHASQHRSLEDGEMAYIASAREMMARAMELRGGMAKILVDDDSFTALQKKQILMGDFSSLGEDETKKLLSKALWKSGADPAFFKALKGKGKTSRKMDADRVDALSRVLKVSLMGGVAAGAYGSMDNQGGQSPNGMANGGVIAIRKKGKGMSAIRK